MQTQTATADRAHREGLPGVLGREIVDGRLPPGQVLTLDKLQDRFGISRTTARDGVKVLESLGLLYSKRRVGLVVNTPGRWNVYAPSVIAWRLDSSQARRAYVELTHLRVAVEPEAVALAAEHRTQQQADRLQELAGTMRRLGVAGRLEEFMLADVDFHRLLLEASGNSMFSALAGVVGEVLTGRTEHGLMPARPVDEALAAHEAVADAVAQNNPAEARHHMQLLVDEVRSALTDSPVTLGE